MELKKDKEKVIIAFSDGDVMEISPSKLQKPIQDKLILYGLYVKLQRATAGAKTEMEKEQKIRAVATALIEGNWEAKPSSHKAVLSETIAQLKTLLPAMDEAGRRALENKIKELEQQIK